jgi:hypothetical protein
MGRKPMVSIPERQANERSPAGKSLHRRKSERAMTETADQVETSSAQSFPASDAPSWTMVRIGRPESE